MREFKNWTYEQVEQVFGILPVKPTHLFKEWLEAKGYGPDAAAKKTLEQLRELLFEEAFNWNEDELKLFFIGPIISLVNFKTAYFKPFTQRTLTVKQGDITASGKVDFMIARGKQVPKTPFFCLHEYKQENRRENDPLGQLLIGMVAAQTENYNPMPVFGSYISGRNWFFVLLQDKSYCLSDAYVASSDDILQIYAILKKGKSLMEVEAKR